MAFKLAEPELQTMQKKLKREYVWSDTHHPAQFLRKYAR